MIRYFRHLLRYRDLLLTMTARDIRVRYKQTLLGAAWAVIQPLAFVVILAGVKIAVFRETAGKSEGESTAVFLYCAMVPWMFFQSSLTFASTSISGNMNLVKKVYFPREIFPASVILACILDFLIASAVLVGMIVLAKLPFTLALLWLIPLFGIELLFVLGVGMGIATANVFYRDIKYIVPLALQLLLFGSPVIYPLDRVPEGLRPLYLFNPMSAVIDGFRRVILHQAPPRFMPFMISFIVALCCFVLGYIYLKSMEDRFADLI